MDFNNKTLDECIEEVFEIFEDTRKIPEAEVNAIVEHFEGQITYDHIVEDFMFRIIDGQ